MADRTEKPYALAFLLLIVSIDAMGIGMYLPIIPTFIARITGATATHAAVIGGQLTVLYSVANFLAAPVFGALSDSIGRRPVLIGSVAAFGVAYFIAAVSPSVAWLYLAMSLAGTFSATAGTANAYISDSSDGSDRLRRLGLLNGAFGIGLVVGPAVGSSLANVGFRIPFLFAAGLAGANALYGYFFLPESLRLEDRKAFVFRQANILKSVAEMRTHEPILTFLGANLLVRLAIAALPATWAYYVSEEFGWSIQMIGLSFTAYGVMVVIAQLVLLPVLAKRLRDPAVLSLGIGLTVLSNLGLALAPNNSVLFLSLSLAALGVIVTPVFAALVSKCVPGSTQGQAQALLVCTNTAATVLASLLMTRLFAAFASQRAALHLPSAPFLAANLLLLIAWLMARTPLRILPTVLAQRRLPT